MPIGVMQLFSQKKNKKSKEKSKKLRSPGLIARAL